MGLGRSLSQHERRTVFLEECRFLLITVPPMMILVVLTIAGVSYGRTIQVIVLSGVLSLGFLGRRCRTPRWLDWLAARGLGYLRFVRRGPYLGTASAAPARPQPLPSVTDQPVIHGVLVARDDAVTRACHRRNDVPIRAPQMVRRVPRRDRRSLTGSDSQAEDDLFRPEWLTGPIARSCSGPSPCQCAR